MFIDYTTITEANAAVARLREKVADLQLERDNSRAAHAAEADKRVVATDALRHLKSNLQEALVDFADANLDEDGSAYQDLHELMVENGLDGLKRKFLGVRTCRCLCIRS